MENSCFKNPIRPLVQSLVDGYYLTRGFWILSKMQQPCISMFGSAVSLAGSKYTTEAYAIAHMLASNGYSIVTGGGPGIMEGIAQGVQSAVAVKKNVSRLKNVYCLGIGVKGIDETFDSTCRFFFRVNSFSVRKQLLLACSTSTIVLPGGIGTMDELFTLLNYIKHKKINAHPVILFGSHYWKFLIQWYEQAIAEGLMPVDFRAFFLVTDDLDEIGLKLNLNSKKLR